MLSIFKPSSPLASSMLHAVRKNREVVVIVYCYSCSRGNMDKEACYNSSYYTLGYKMVKLNMGLGPWIHLGISKMDHFVSGCTQSLN